MMNKLPKITAVIPCRNESSFIGNCLESVVNAEYPKDLIEVLVIDGNSSDGSFNLIKKYAKLYPQIKYYENPRLILAAAWNIGIQKANGNIIFAMNAHASIEKNYFINAVNFLIENSCDAVGPVIITHPQHDSEFGNAISTAMSNSFGVGNSKFRVGVQTPTKVDTVHMGAYRSYVFDKVGLYNENLIRSQDIEFHKRMGRLGMEIYLDPENKVHYYTRSKAKGFLRYGFLNGFWVTRPYAFGTSIASIRHLVPAFFCTALIFFGIGSFYNDYLMYILMAILIVYFLMAYIISINESVKQKNPYLILFLPIVFITYHITYGLGSIWGLLTALPTLIISKK